MNAIGRAFNARPIQLSGNRRHPSMKIAIVTLSNEMPATALDPGERTFAAASERITKGQRYIAPLSRIRR